MRSRARPTILPTRGAWTPAERHRLLDSWRRPSASRGVGRAARSGAAARRAGTHRRDIPRGRRNDPRPCPAGGPVRGSLERVPPGRRRDPLFDVGRCPGLLPPFGQSGWPPRAADRRPSHRAARRMVRRHLHRAAAHELLAGPGARSRSRPRLSASRGAARPRRARRRPGGGAHHAGMAGGARVGRSAHARAVQRRQADLRRLSRPHAIRAARDVAGRHADSRSRRRREIRRRQSPPDARRSRCAVVRLEAACLGPKRGA